MARLHQNGTGRRATAAGLRRRDEDGDAVDDTSVGRATLITSSANGVARDIAAVRAAIVSYRSNSQTESQITKLKLVKTARHELICT